MSAKHFDPAYEYEKREKELATWLNSNNTGAQQETSEIIRALQDEVNRLNHEAENQMNRLLERDDKLARLKKIASEQANDKMLWFIPYRMTEDILQRALRDLHKEIEK